MSLPFLIKLLEPNIVWFKMIRRFFFGSKGVPTQ
jgi:hypothetical protein